MADTIHLFNKLASLPEDLKTEVENFIDFLKAKPKSKKPKQSPKFGSGKGVFIIKEDFDEPLGDFNEYMS